MQSILLSFTLRASRSLHFFFLLVYTSLESCLKTESVSRQVWGREGNKKHQKLYNVSMIISYCHSRLHCTSRHFYNCANWQHFNAVTDCLLDLQLFCQRVNKKKMIKLYPVLYILNINSFSQLVFFWDLNSPREKYFISMGATVCRMQLLKHCCPFSPTVDVLMDFAAYRWRCIR